MVVEPHRHNGVFISRGKEDALVTKNLVPGDTVYGEKKIEVVQVSSNLQRQCSYSYVIYIGWA